MTSQRHDLFGDQLGGVEHVEGQLVGGLLVEHLEGQLPFREVAAVDRVPQIAPVEVGIRAADLARPRPRPRELEPCTGRQWNFTKVDLPAALTSRKVWTPKPSIMRSERGMARSDIAHMTMCMALRHQRDEIPERVVRGGRLRKAAVGLHLHRMDQVGELHRVLDEEDRDVVADQVEVAFLGVELHREAAHVARQVDRAGAAGHGREAHEHPRLRCGSCRKRRLVRWRIDLVGWK